MIMSCLNGFQARLSGWRQAGWAVVVLAVLMTVGVLWPPVAQAHWFWSSHSLLGVGHPNWQRPGWFSAEPTMRRDTLRAINRYREAYHLLPLHLDERLNQAAWNHACYMAQYDSLVHFELSGQGRRDPGTRAILAGYRWGGIAENIAQGYDSAEEVVMAWEQSPDHRRHLLDPRMTDVGIGRRGDFWSLTLAHP